jgi:hypothetical protein
MDETTGFADRDGSIWMNNKLVPWRDARIHVLTTLHYGLGVFEGVRAYATPGCGDLPAPRPPGACLNLHPACRFPSSGRLNRAQCQVIKANGLEEGTCVGVLPRSEAMGLRADGLSVNDASQPGRGRHPWIGSAQARVVRVVYPPSVRHHRVQGRPAEAHQLAPGAA